MAFMPAPPTFELPAPIDYTTYTSTVEAGYRSKETTAALTAGLSHFDNEDDIYTLRFGSVNSGIQHSDR